VAEPSGNPPGPPQAARNATHYACQRRLTPLAGNKIDAPASCAVPFRPYCGGVITRTRNVSEYMLVLALCLVFICRCIQPFRSYALPTDSGLAEGQQNLRFFPSHRF